MCQSPLGVFFLKAFSFAPVYAKEKADRHKSFVLAVGCTWVLSCRGRRLRRPAKYHKVTFLLSYFCVTKSTKSHQRERSPLFENSSRVHELVAGSSAWRVRATQKQCKSRRFCYHPQFQLYHACEHITRKSRADSCTHCLHAR